MLIKIPAFIQTKLKECGPMLKENFSIGGGGRQVNMRRHLAEFMIQGKLGNQHNSFVEFLKFAHNCSTSAYPEGNGVSIESMDRNRDLIRNLNLVRNLNQVRNLDLIPNPI